MAEPWGADMLARTVEIAERCDAQLDLDTLHLPRVRRARGASTAPQYLRELAETGLRERYGAETPELRERLEFELRTIEEMGYADYFLIVWDFIRFARQDGVSVGPGRGSAAGSLVAYCLRITDLDPMRYSLLFERFLNPGRKSLPDIDIDFAVAGRERVINYVAEKYGRRNVAQIITFGKMQPKAAIKDAGRVMGIPYGVVDRIAKLVPEGPKISFEACMKAGRRAAPVLRHRRDDPLDRRHGDAARGRRPQRLDPRRSRRDRRPAADRVPAAPAEGRRLRGRHPVLDERRRRAGPAQDGLPRPAKPRRDRPGRRDHRAVDRHRARHGRGAARRQEDLRDDGARRRDGRLPVRVDGHARRAAAGEADRVRGHRRPRRALPAGPDAVHPRLRRATRPTRAASPTRTPALLPILETTHGICIYQEQYMEIAKALAGFSPAEADDLRKAIGKKIASLMASLKDKFTAGCEANGVPAATAHAALGQGRAGGRLQLQQGPRRLLRPDRLPHGVPARQLSGRVHGRADLVGHVDQGPRAVLRRRVRRHGRRGAAARRQLEPVRLRRGRRAHPLRPGGSQAGRRGRGAGDHRRPQRAAVRLDLGLLRAGRHGGR